MFSLGSLSVGGSRWECLPLFLVTGGVDWDLCLPSHVLALIKKTKMMDGIETRFNVCMFPLGSPSFGWWLAVGTSCHRPLNGWGVRPCLLLVCLSTAPLHLHLAQRPLGQALRPPLVLNIEQDWDQGLTVICSFERLVFFRLQFVPRLSVPFRISFIWICATC